MRQSILVMFALLTLPHCATLNGKIKGLTAQNRVPPKIEVVQLATAPATEPKTQPHQIQVYENTRALPRGFFYAHTHDKKKLYAVVDYPSAEQPHLVLAGIVATHPSGQNRYLPNEQILTAQRTKASQLGANAIFVTGDKRVAYAMIVSKAATTAAPVDHQLLLKLTAAKHTEYKKQGAPVAHPLQQFPQIDLALKKGRCYRLNVALDKQATLNAEGQRWLSLQVKSNDGLLFNRSVLLKEEIAEVDGFKLSAPSHGAYVLQRAYSLDMGCSSSAARATYQLQTRGRSSVLGQGQVWLQVSSKKISKAELTQKVAAMNQAKQKAATEAKAFALKEAQRAQQREAERLARQQQRSAAPTTTGTTSAGPAHYSFSLSSDCRQTVLLYLNNGGNPKFSGGQTDRIAYNNRRSYSGFAPKTFWIVDSSGNGVSSFTATASTRDMKVTASCSGFAQR